VRRESFEIMDQCVVRAGRLSIVAEIALN